MSREIKFRGYDEENKVWRYGWYTKLTEGIRRIHAIISDVDGELTRFYIHSDETLGQFTGLHDKNGQEVYEGDIIQNTSALQWVGVILYYPHECRYTAAEIEEWPDGTIYNSALINEPGDNWMMYECEVIGNIHENKELLK